jgi:transcriptional regulator with GAF, ATPase, and Fis domain
VRRALEIEAGNQALAAKRLGLQPSNLSRLLQTLGLR